MSFYAFLLLTSLLCYTQARPSAPVEVENSSPPAGKPAPVEPNPPEESNESEDQKKIDELLKQVQNALDVYITPLMVNVSKEDQDILKNLGLEEFAGSVNYLLYIIQELNDPNYNGGVVDRSSEDFIVDLDSYNPFPGAPFIEQKDGSSTQ